MNNVINVLIKTDEPIPVEQEQDLLSRIEDAITAACKEYGIGEPSWVTAQYDDWMKRASS
jgi:hypothetical protein